MCFIEPCSFVDVRSMDKYARFMQKLEIVNVEFFKVCYTVYISCFLVFYLFKFKNLWYFFPSKLFFLIQYSFAGYMPVV